MSKLKKTDFGGVVFTKHALERLVERHKVYVGTDLKDPLATAQKIFAKAVPEKSGALVRRLIRYRFRATLYFVEAGWRVVCQEDKGRLKVLTIERSED